MLRDLRHGFRLLLQAKGWTAVVVLSLAVGIGANATVFTAVNGLLLRKLPVADPDSLVRIRWGGKNDMANDTNDYELSAPGPDGEKVTTTFSYPMFQYFRSANQTMTDLVGSRPAGITVTIDGRAETASALLVTGNYHALLGVTARLGRTIAPEDDNPAVPAVATLSDRYWRSRFAADPAVLGKTISINKVPVTIIGVTTPSFTGTQLVNARLQDFTMALRLDDQISGDDPRMNDATAWSVQVTGRLKPGITPEQVVGNLGPVFQHQARAGLEAFLASASEKVRSESRNQGRTAVPHLLADSARRGTYDTDERQMRALSILSAVAVLVLVLVCANVANLQLSRAAARQREISVRFMTMLTGIIFGIAPALRATKMDVGSALKENSRSVAASNTILSRALLVMQVSISVVLLVGAGLFLNTLNNLRSVDLGFNPQNLVFVRVDAEGGGLSDERKFQFLQDAMARLQTVSGVKAATVSKPTLLSGATSGTAMFVQGRPMQAATWRSATINGRRKWLSSTRRRHGNSFRVRIR